MKRVFRIFIWALVVLIAVIIVKAFAFQSRQVSVGDAATPVAGPEAAERLAAAVRIPTISYDIDMPVDTLAFTAFREYLQETYPAIHSQITPMIFNEFSLLYKWDGSNPALKPVVLLAHMDVVPAGDEELWTKTPFSGEVDGEYIWGRGTLDDKGALIQIMEAVEKLISEGFRPARTYYLAFGHDEEISGRLGAGTIASYLAGQGVEAEFVADEGMAVTIGMVPMMSEPVALIGTSEKGYLSVKLSATMDGGHSSTPEEETALTLIADAVTELVENQLKPRISGPVDDFIRYVGPEMPFYARAIFANKWIFKPLLLNIYSGSSSGNALVRTTTAPTIITAGVKDNVVPATATAVVNFRILAGETSEDIIKHVKKVIGDDRIVVEALPGAKEPAPVSPVDVYGFASILKTIRQVYPEAVVAPTMMLASSDSRHYTEVSGNIYRFAPIIVTSDDMARIHGVDERVRIEDYLRGITYYYYLIRNSNDEEMK
ncbi:MAG: M20/M25/M40 family metallo-hydrolase [Bacteroidales bacterium]|nr:M20/M25/M40 family metallo-hydrolase [Bacteroidales bacterium]